jgi:ATP-dependent DNA helicase PIF1
MRTLAPISLSAPGIVILLLDGGCTAHSTFKIPFEVNEYSICSINNNSEYASML